VFDFRYWSQNKDDDMRNEARSEKNWIARRNQAKINFWTKLQTAIFKIKIFKIATNNPETHPLPVLFRLVTRIADRNH
jgi:hypothetical protein